MARLASPAACGRQCASQGTHAHVPHPRPAHCRSIPRGYGAWGDMVVELRDGSKVEMRSLDRWAGKGAGEGRRRLEQGGRRLGQGGRRGMRMETVWGGVWGWAESCCVCCVRRRRFRELQAYILKRRDELAPAAPRRGAELSQEELLGEPVAPKGKGGKGFA